MEEDRNATAAAILARARAALDEPRPHTLTDLAAAAGLAADDVARLFTAAERHATSGTYGDTDLAYVRDLAVLVNRSSVEAVERQLRLRLRFITQIVVRDLGALRLDTTLGDMIEAGTDPEQLAVLAGMLASEVVPAVERQLGADYRAALHRLLGSQVLSQVAADGYRQPTVSVGFVDLVGFTRLSASTDPAGVGEVLTAFEDLADRAAHATGDVLLAKTIGDAVLFVASAADALVDVLLHTVEESPAGLEDVPRRAGMAHGEVLVRDGDYVGTTVNTAARLTDLARPGTVVVSPEAAAALGEHWEQSRLPPVRLKGLGTARPVRVRRPAAQ